MGGAVTFETNSKAKHHTLPKMTSYSSAANSNMPFLCSEVEFGKVTFADVVAGKTSSTFKSAFIN